MTRILVGIAAATSLIAALLAVQVGVPGVAAQTAGMGEVAQTIVVVGDKKTVAPQIKPYQSAGGT